MRQFRTYTFFNSGILSLEDRLFLSAGGRIVEDPVGLSAQVGTLVGRHVFVVDSRPILGTGPTPKDCRRQTRLVRGHVSLVQSLEVVLSYAGNGDPHLDGMEVIVTCAELAKTDDGGAFLVEEVHGSPDDLAVWKDSPVN